MSRKKYVAYAIGNDDSDRFFTSIESAVGGNLQAIEWFNQAKPGDSLVMQDGAFFGWLTLIKLSGEHTELRR